MRSRCGNIAYHIEGKTIPCFGSLGRACLDHNGMFAGSYFDHLGVPRHAVEFLGAVAGQLEFTVNINLDVGVSVFAAVAEADLDPACIYLSRYIESLAVRVIDLRVVPAGPVVEVRPRVAARSG